MAFTEDLSIFFADFGVDATLAAAPVRGIFDDDYVDSGLGARGMAGSGPAFTLASAQVPASPYGAALVVPGHGNYSVVEHRPDGTGLSVLLLEKAA